MSYLDNYEIIPEDERRLYEQKTANVINPANRRELKIKQYQKEKDLRARIEVNPSAHIQFCVVLTMHLIGDPET